MSSQLFMTNDELAVAIAYAFERCNQKFVSGYVTSDTEPGKAMLAHLKTLLEVQIARAKSGPTDTPP